MTSPLPHVLTVDVGGDPERWIIIVRDAAGVELDRATAPRGKPYEADAVVVASAASLAVGRAVRRWRLKAVIP
jgi:hypothetical protein